jgi:hypothetical protein
MLGITKCLREEIIGLGHGVSLVRDYDRGRRRPPTLGPTGVRRPTGIHGVVQPPNHFSRDPFFPSSLELSTKGSRNVTLTRNEGGAFPVEGGVLCCVQLLNRSCST